MGKTTIQWSDFSINPIRARLRGDLGTIDGPPGVAVGHYCEKISAGCKNCYASRMQPRFGLPVFNEQRGENAPEVFLDPSKLAEVLRRRKPTKWFWCDMTDMFGDWVRDEWIAACFGVMAATPQHTHQVLTKRPERARRWFSFDWTDRHVGLAEISGYAGRAIGKSVAYGQAWPLPNVHLGVSAEDQPTFDARWRDLQRIPAAVRWFSLEPMIAPIDVHQAVARFCGCPQAPEPSPCDAYGTARGCPNAPPRASWFVVGGESGQRARKCNTGWIRGIIDQCRGADIPCFVKQIGANVETAGPVSLTRLKDSHGGDPSEWPESLRVREFPR